MTISQWKHAGIVVTSTDHNEINKAIENKLVSLGIYAKSQNEGEEALEYHKRLLSLANLFCPNDYYFGPAPGEPQCYGFWELPF